MKNLVQTWVDLMRLWPTLTNSQRVKAHKLATIAMWETLRIPWTPIPGRQIQAAFSQADELFYGGAAGGAKSQLLLGLASTEHSKSIIFRREYRQLGGATGLIESSKNILRKTKARYAEGKGWRDVPGGRAIEFGSVQYAGDWENFSGRPHDFMGFDELPQFLESQYRALVGWNRTDDPNQRCRIVSTGNPPTTVEGRWVLDYWSPWLRLDHPNPAKPGELRWYTRLDDEDVEVPNGESFLHRGERVRPKSRTFIPARLGDNPYLMLTSYGITLQALPEPLRSQMLSGDFTADIKDDAWQVIPTDHIRAAQERWKQRERPTTPMSALGVDPARGGKDETVFAPRWDNYFGELIAYPGSMTPNGPSVAGLILNAIDLSSEVVINIDVIGIGSSVYDSLMLFIDAETEDNDDDQDLSSFHVNPINFGAGTYARDKSGQLAMANVRAAAYWALREALDPITGDDLALPPDNMLLADLVAPRWRPTTKGVQIESKEDIKKRLGRSPDRGDALALAAYLGGVGGIDLAFA